MDATLITVNLLKDAFVSLMCETLQSEIALSKIFTQYNLLLKPLRVLTSQVQILGISKQKWSEKLESVELDMMIEYF
jgi:hypothetical protein